MILYHYIRQLIITINILHTMKLRFILQNIMIKIGSDILNVKYCVQENYINLYYHTDKNVMELINYYSLSVGSVQKELMRNVFISIVFNNVLSVLNKEL